MNETRANEACSLSLSIGDTAEAYSDLESRLPGLALRKVSATCESVAAAVAIAEAAIMVGDIGWPASSTGFSFGHCLFLEL
jgi:hypothetical protein